MQDKMIVVKPQILEAAIEEVEACFVEGIFHSNITKLEMYHNIGNILRNAPAPISELIRQVSDRTSSKYKDLGERSLWFAVQLYDKYPESLDALPFGKNVTINKVKKFLADPESLTAPQCSHFDTELIQVARCKDCGKKV